MKEMITNQPKKELGQNTGYVFTCGECGLAVPVYTELWKSNMETLFKMKFIYHIDGIAKVVNEITIHDLEENENDKWYHFCGRCDGLLKEPMDIDLLLLLNNFFEKEFHETDYRN